MRSSQPSRFLLIRSSAKNIYYRSEAQTERLDGDQITKSLDAPSGSPECRWITRLHVEVQQFGMPSFKQALESVFRSWWMEAGHSAEVEAFRRAHEWVGGLQSYRGLERSIARPQP